MAAIEGVFTLTSAEDLLAKLGRDLARIEREPWNPDPAFDFFVTAEHMLDWRDPDRKPRDSEAKERRGALRESEPLLRITSHIANGAKHFRPLAARHKSIQGTGQRTSGGLQSDGFQSNAFAPATTSPVVDLSDDEATSVGCKEIAAVDLARRVLEYWKAH